MNDYSILNRIWVGSRKNLKKLFISIFFTYTALWTILDSLMSMLKPLETYITGSWKYLLLVLVSIVVGMCRVIRPKKISLKYNNSTIIISFGDLFSFDGIKAIPVSRFFFEIEVIKKSLQDAVIQKFRDSEEGSKGLDKYIERLSTALNGVAHDLIKRKVEEEKFYPIGTTALIKLNDDSYLLFALTETELKEYIRHGDNCSVTDMWIALEKFWNDARDQARGNPVNIPLIGSGVTGIELSPIRILEMNLLAILSSMIEKGIITDEIRVILHHKFFKEIDLRLIKQTWKNFS